VGSVDGRVYCDQAVFVVAAVAGAGSAGGVEDYGYGAGQCVYKFEANGGVGGVRAYQLAGVVDQGVVSDGGRVD
jgi:hypothetical protein